MDIIGMLMSSIITDRSKTTAFMNNSFFKLLTDRAEKYPLVQIALHTGIADAIQTRMNKGLVDIGLFMKPVRIQTGRLQIDVRRFFFSS